MESIKQQVTGEREVYQREVRLKLLPRLEPGIIKQENQIKSNSNGKWELKETRLADLCCVVREWQVCVGRRALIDCTTGNGKCFTCGLWQIGGKKKIEGISTYWVYVHTRYVRQFPYSHPFEAYGLCFILVKLGNMLCVKCDYSF